MPNNYNDGYMAETGKKSEQIVIEWLGRSSQVKDVVPVMDSKMMQRVDVDVAVVLEDGRTILVEIKNDKNIKDGNDGNMLFELQRVYTTASPGHTSTLGWSVRTPAEYIAWYASKIEKIVLIKTTDYRIAFQEYMRKAGRNPRYDTQVTTENFCTTINVIFDKKYLFGRFEMYELDEQVKFELVEETVVPF